MKTFGGLAAGIALSALCGAGAAAQETREFAVVGTWGMLAHWQDRESVFWNETLPAASEGRLTANARPLTELGMDGTTIMRELRVGAFDFAHGVFLYVAGDSPVIEGSDLSGVTPDLATFRKVMEVYRPVLQAEFRKLFNSHILMLYAWPQTHLICNFPDGMPTEIDLSTFEGTKVRSFGASMADFITGALNAVPVAVAFGEVLPSLEKGALDCGATGVLSAWSAKWQQGTTHDLQVSLGYTASFLAVNNDVWTGLTDAERALLETEIGKLEDEMWEATARDDADGIACLSDGPCERGEPGGLKQLTLTPEALAEMKARVERSVIANWAERCEARSPGCVADWNATIGALLGYEAKL